MASGFPSCDGITKSLGHRGIFVSYAFPELLRSLVRKAVKLTRLHSSAIHVVSGKEGGKMKKRAEDNEPKDPPGYKNGFKLNKAYEGKTGFVGSCFKAATKAQEEGPVRIQIPEGLAKEELDYACARLRSVTWFVTVADGFLVMEDMPSQEALEASL